MLKPLNLKNDLTVLRLPKNGTKIFLIGFIASTGSATEDGYFPQGTSYLVERLFWRGTEKHPSRNDLNLALESMGGSFYSQTGQEMTQYYLTVPSSHQFKAVSMLAEVIQQSYFDAKDMEVEKKLILEEIKNQEEVLDIKPSQLAASSLYENHNLGLPIKGSVDSITSINQENVFEYLARQYNPQNSYLVIAGDFETKAVSELIDQEWSFWNPRQKKFIEPLDLHTEDLGEFPKIQYRQRGIAQTNLSIAFLLDEGMQLPKEFDKNGKEIQLSSSKALEKTLKNWAEILVLNTILGEGLSSRLWTKTVEEEHLFWDLSSSLFRYKKTGFLEIFGVVQNSQFTFGLESVLSTLEGLKKTVVSINEIYKAKELIKGKLIYTNEDILTGTSWLIENLIGSELTFEVDDLLKAIDQVEAPQIRSLAIDIFTQDRLAITSLGTAKETRLVDKLVRKYLG